MGVAYAKGPILLFISECLRIIARGRKDALRSERCIVVGGGTNVLSSQHTGSGRDSYKDTALQP